MLTNIIQIVSLALALNDSTGCTVDRVEGTVSVLTCDGVSSVDVASSYVGAEGTTYGTVESVTARYTVVAGTVVL